MRGVTSVNERKVCRPHRLFVDSETINDLVGLLLLKAGKLTPIPNAQLGLNVDVRSENVDVPLKTLDPLRASDFYPTDRLQFDAFADTDGHRQCKNQLYVYPTGLCYGSQKSFSRARNILCTVRFLRQSRLRPQFVDLAKGTLVTEKHCTVQYHDANPSFFNEIRVELPVDLEEDDHLIFEFSHISLTAAQKSGDETVNQKAGIAWLQLVKPDKSLVLNNDVDEFELPVATNLPTDYFKLDQHSTPSRKSSDGSIKWVEGGKPLFKVKLRLHSTLFSSNPLLNRFFQQCLSPNQPTLNVKPDLLLQIPFERLEPHLFVTLSSLLQLFTRASDLSSAAILTTLVGILENSTKCQKKSELREFIKFHLAVGGEFEVDCRALYEGLLEAVGILLSSAQTEQSIIISTLSHLWFIIDVTVKSMTQTILTNGSHKYSRRRRFSQLTLEAIDATFLAVSQQILQNHQKFAAETRSANLALAYLAKHSLNIADRGAIYASLYEIIKRYDTNEVGLPRHFKLDLMQILVGHEHWLPLNLPMLFDSNNKPLLGLAGTKIDDHAQDAIRVAKTALKTTNILSRLFFQFLPSPLTQSTQNKKTELNPEHFKLGKTFCSTHFLVGLLLQEFVAALHESRAYRRLVIAMLRNLLVKHSLDLRYDGASQSRIAVLYAPFVQILIEHVDEFEIFGKLEDSERAEERKESVKFDYAQSTARSILSKDISTLNGASGRAATNNFNGKVSQFTEKLDLNEARDLILCVLYILNNLPKQVTVSLAFNQQTSEAFDKKEDDFLAMINLLKVSLTLFRSHQKSGFPTIKHPSLPSKEQKSLSAKQLKKLFIQDSHLSQEVALIVLDVAHNLAEFVAGRWNGSQLDAEQERKAFLGIIDLILDLVGDQWPEGVRLNALNTLGMFIELFSNQLSSDRSNEALPKLCQRLLLLLNSRLEKVQCAAAAILHLLIRQGFNVTFEEYAKQVDSQPNSVRLPNEGKASADWLGNAGLQITIALAYLLGQNELSADSPRFEHGIHLFESLTANQLDQKLELFKRSAQDLATQLRDIVKATMSITEARNDPVRLAELHVKLADSYRGSPALRAAWFDTLAQIHRAEHWFSEAAVCQAHCVAIIAKQLKAREKIDIDLSLLSCLNHQILEDERVNELELPLWHSGNFTIDAFTSKVEETVKVLIDAERYEAVGPIYRMAIPLHENAFNNKALTSVYAELHQAYSRAAEIQTSRKRHLGSYFRVILHSTIHFGDEHQSAWIYKEPALTSLAEESERMVRLFRKILRTEKVRFLTDAEVSIDLDPSIAHIQLTHVDPLLGDQDDQIDFAKHLKQTDSADVNYSAHTNISNFYFEKPLIEPINEESNEKVPEQARLALKRVFLKTKETFPNTRRRLPIIKISEEILSPLELACENLIKKASQIQQVLSSAGIGATGPVDRSKLQALDMKGLQCLLQGSVSPTVNVGVLAYAEAFTSDSQRSKYGVEGMERLKQSFKVFMAQLARALMVNELAVAEDQAEYQIMLKNSFDGMLERLCTFFDGENFLPDNVNPFVTKPKNESNDPIPPKSSYILDSISGIPHRL
uniref:DOCKER domain-containing protein n=1 Tax=Bursaphelenchus xylophilus TaxID=6326 RepID=A0A1I7SEQ5_BURXY